MKFILSALIAVLASCSSPIVVSGHYFDDEWVDSIVVGETTVEEVREWFGDPVWSSSPKQGLILFHYAFKLGPVPSASSSSESGGEPKLAGKALVIGFKNDVVYHHAFSENEAGHAGTVVRSDS